MEKDILVKVTAHNCPGLLQRVCALFSRRFFNILSMLPLRTSTLRFPRFSLWYGVTTGLPVRWRNSWTNCMMSCRLRFWMPTRSSCGNT